MGLLSSEMTAFMESEVEAEAYVEVMKEAGWDSRAVKLGDKWAVKSKAVVE